MLASLLAGTLAASDRGMAATVSYDLTGDVASQYSSAPTATTHLIDLTDATTGAYAIDAATLSLNDTISATVSLNAPWTIAAAGAVGLLSLNLGTFTDSTSYVQLRETTSFYLNGSKLNTPSWTGTEEAITDIGGLELGAFGFGDITFTSVVLTAQVVDMGQLNGSTLISAPPNTSLSVTPVFPVLENTVLPNPVPLNGTFWLLLSGLLGVFCFQHRPAIALGWQRR